MLELKGRWHILQGPASYEEALELTSGMPQELLRIPSYWEGAITDSSGFPLPNNGDAYLILELELTEERPELAVYVESAGSAHTLSIYDADRLVGRVQAGRVAEFKEQEIPWWRLSESFASRTILDANSGLAYLEFSPLPGRAMDHAAHWRLRRCPRAPYPLWTP